MENLYAEVAPLPVAVADHLLQRFIRSHADVPDKESLFVSTVKAKRRAAFAVMDPYVRVGELTRAWVMESLAVYGHSISQRTFTYWQQRNLIEMSQFGKIKPLSAQALLVAGMIDPRQRGFLPPDGVPAHDTWRCYIQRQPDACVEIWPTGRLDELPPSTLCWTPISGAYWDEAWHPVGEGNLGCIRFAGVKWVHGRIWYDVTIDDLRVWDAEIAALYTPFPGDSLAQIQIYCYPLFHRLAHARLSERRL